MKNTFLVIASTLLLASCATLYRAPRSYIGIIDYSPLTEQGIYVTESNSVSFDYKAIGSVYAEEVGGWVRKDGKPESNDPKEPYYLFSSGKKKIYVLPDINSIFKKLVDQLKQSGADGIVNLKIESTIEQDLATKLPYDKIIVTGMAIKK